MPRSPFIRGEKEGWLAKLMLTREDSGTAVVATPGTEIVIRLDENPTTGYAWTVDEVDEGIVTIADNGPSQPEEALVGAGGVHTFTVTAHSEGTTEVRLKHWRSWEGEPSVIERYRVTVSVAES